MESPHIVARSKEVSIACQDWLIAFQIWAGYGVLIASFPFFVAVVSEDHVSARRLSISCKTEIGDGEER